MVWTMIVMDKLMRILQIRATNIDEGTELYSDVVLEAADGSTITLTPDTITQGSITVTIPGNLASGNYKVKPLK